jgi:MFS family permease
MAASHDARTIDAAEHRRQLRHAVLAATIGTAIKRYDFFLYSTVMGLVFARLYFPRSDPFVGTLEAFSVYAVGFLARPIGAAIFGHYGDRLGRKAADRDTAADGQCHISGGLRPGL